MNRIEFFESVDGIKYPEMLVNFFDHFVALKQIVEDNGKIFVESCANNIIKFSINFPNSVILQSALNLINNSSSIIIYGREISINIEGLTDTDILISLQ